jgi:hypothetical protein
LKKSDTTALSLGNPLELRARGVAGRSIRARQLAPRQ